MIDGVVRAPSLFSITLGVLPSMIDTHEFVVPRSMPMIFPMIWLLLNCVDLAVDYMWMGGGLSSPADLISAR
jgi:hypothetical protein